MKPKKDHHSEGVNLHHKYKDVGVIWDTDEDEPIDKADSAWEKKMNVDTDAEGHFADKDMGHVHEVDLTKEVHVVGMPPEDESRCPDCSYD